MAAPYKGGCTCGAIRYLLNDEPLTLYVCHCTDCQSLSGSAFGMSMPILRSSLQLVSGEPDELWFTTPEGRRKGNKRCGACGARLWGEPPRFTDVLILRPGTLDSSTGLEPVAHIWLGSAQPWVPIPDNVLRFQGQPRDDLELVRAWSDRPR